MIDKGLKEKQVNWPSQKQSDFIIAGPCSAESPEQMISVAKDLASNGRVSALRAGVWKPRTRPGSFEGRGEEALSWMKNASEESGLPLITEVANANHVEACLKTGVDMLWLGARTTVNPFYVQEIADALKGVDIPVWVKNPMHPDLGLWLGAVERIQDAGIEKVGAVLRGFYSYDSRPFRNEPKWEMSLELKRVFPDLPILCDPSHIAGQKSLIPELCQIAIDLDMNGLMIEVHPHPEKALSDSKQQITPTELNAMLDGLVWRKSSSSNKEFLDQLEQLRKEIDEVDESLVNILAKRMDLVSRIGNFKAENNVTIFQLKRWFDIMQQRKLQGKDLGLSEELIHELYQLIHKNSIRIQSGVMKKNR